MSFFLVTNKFKSKLGLFKNVNQTAKTASSLVINIKRTFLTENYYCYDRWDKFLMSDIMKKAGTVNSFSIELDSKLAKKELATPLDMDLLAAKLVHITSHQELDFIENIFANFRKTQASLYARDSMHYSFIRSYLDLNQGERLLQILKHKYKYGIFINSYSANMLIDVFLKEKDYLKATLASHEVLLQEENQNQLTLAACLVSCMKYVNHLKKNNMEFGDINNQDSSTSDDKPKKKLLVYFLRKEYNDQHFDLNKISHLTGKTIYFSSSNAQNLDPILKNSLMIYGQLLFEKYDEAMTLFHQIFVKEQSKVHHFVIEEFKKAYDKLKSNEDDSKKNEKFLEKWQALSKVCENNEQILNDDGAGLNKIVEQLDIHLEKTRQTQTDLDIASQEKLISKWQQEQENELNEQIRNYKIEMKKKNIIQQLNDLEKQEEMLTFFERRQEIIDYYFNKGFPIEFPSQIPIEPDESIFKAKSERHFKPWPKYANKPHWYNKISRGKQARIDSLKKIYLTNDSSGEQTSRATSKSS